MPAPARPLKILFVMQSPEYLRYFDSALALLTSRGHRVAIAVNKANRKKKGSLEDGAAVDPRVTSLGFVPARDDRWAPLARAIRGTIDYARFLDPRYADAEALRARMRRKVLPAGVSFLGRLSTLPRMQTRGALRLLLLMERAVPSSDAIERFISDVAPDLVLVSPLVDAASAQVDVVKSAQALGIPTAVCVASWDNLTNKGHLRIVPDAVIVWNEVQRREACELHGVPSARVVTTGAQLFDRWFDRVPGRERGEFCARVGLPSQKPFVLFVGSSGFIADASSEVRFVREWISAIRQAPDSAVRDLAILVRPHPYNCDEWGPVDLSDCGEVAIWPRERTSLTDEAARTDYFDSLFHSAAVVGINTSAMIEAAVVGRPVHSILASAFAGTQEGTLHFHYLLPEHGGFLEVARELPVHVRQLADSILHRDAIRDRTRRFVEAFVRPAGIERPATPVFVEAVERVGGRGLQPPARVPAWLAPLRFALWVIAGFLQNGTASAGRKRRDAHRDRRAATRTAAM